MTSAKDRRKNKLRQAKQSATQSNGNQSTTQSNGNQTTTRSQGVDSKNVDVVKTPEKVEDDTLEANQDGKSQDAESQVLLPRRPAYATYDKNRAIQLKANCVEIQTPPDTICLYHYAVKVTRIKPVAAAKPPQAKESSVETASQPAADQTAGTGNNNESDDTEARGSKLSHILYYVFNTKDFFKDLIETGRMASDFRNNVFTTEELTDEQSSFEIQYKGEKSRYHLDKFRVTFAPPESEPSVFKCPLTTLSKYLQSTNPEEARRLKVEGHFDKIIHGLNIFLRHQSKNAWLDPSIHDGPSILDDSSIRDIPKQAVVGSKSYDLTSNRYYSHLSGVVTAIRGCFSSLRPAAGRLLLNLNVTFGLFFREQSLAELVHTFRLYNIPPEQVHAFLNGIRVRLRHRESSEDNLRYIKTNAGLATKEDGVEDDKDAPKIGKNGEDGVDGVDGIEYDKEAPQIGMTWDQISFKVKGAKKAVTVHAHFKSKYPSAYVDLEKTIAAALKKAKEFGPKDKDFRGGIVVNVGTQKRPDHVPVAACDIVKGQSYRAALGPNETSAMIRIACKKPEQAVAGLSDVAHLSGLKTQKEQSSSLSLGIDLKSTGDQLNLIQLVGMQLNYPSVKFDKTALTIDQQKARWNLGKLLGTPKGSYTKIGLVQDWAVLVIMTPKQTQSDERDAEGRGTLRQKMKARFGMESLQRERQAPTLRVRTCTLPDGQDCRPYKDALQWLKDKGKVRLVLVWLPGNDVSAGRYKDMKRISDSEVGIHTVLVTKEKAAAGDQQYWDNVLLKMNLKLGGVNQTVSMPGKLVDFKTTMVVGMDVTHRDPGAEEGATSTVGMVASVDEHLGQWPGTLCAQVPPKKVTEIVCERSSIDAVLKPHLEGWNKKHKAYPQQILIYRDGVGEGQYQQVIDHEYRHIKALCESLDPKRPGPRITIVVVGKRHHMRFYQYKDKSGKATQHMNPPPGTLVDRSVTSQFLWEFYLQAQYPIQGTARPSHYVVVVDNIFRNISEEQILKAKLQGCKAKNQSDVLYAVTHALSYGLGRATTATSVCAPAFWADKLCDRARFFDQAALRAHPDIADSMYYV